MYSLHSLLVTMPAVCVLQFFFSSFVTLVECQVSKHIVCIRA